MVYRSGDYVFVVGCFCNLESEIVIDRRRSPRLKSDVVGATGQSFRDHREGGRKP
jgi:hypothetical protein